MRITFHAIAQHVIASALPDHFPDVIRAKGEHKRTERAERVLLSSWRKRSGNGPHLPRMLPRLMGKFARAARILVLKLRPRRRESLAFRGLGHAGFFEPPRRSFSLLGKLRALVGRCAVAAAGRNTPESCRICCFAASAA